MHERTASFVKKKKTTASYIKETASIEQKKKKP
jgi:hypothetical protein